MQNDSLNKNAALVKLVLGDETTEMIAWMCSSASHRNVFFLSPLSWCHFWERTAVSNNNKKQKQKKKQLLKSPRLTSCWASEGEVTSAAANLVRYFPLVLPETKKEEFEKNLSGVIYSLNNVMMVLLSLLLRGCPAG